MDSVWGEYSGSTTNNYGLDYGTSVIQSVVNGVGEGSIYDKFGVKNRVQAAMKAVILGLIDLNIFFVD